LGAFIVGKKGGLAGQHLDRGVNLSASPRVILGRKHRGKAVGPFDKNFRT